MRPPVRRIFQRVAWDIIDMPDLWSRSDEERARDEGWGVGMILGTTWRARRDEDAIVCIGKLSGTFISNEDAYEWVAQQAKRLSSSTSIYNRALATVAAYTIKMSGR